MPRIVPANGNHIHMNSKPKEVFHLIELAYDELDDYDREVIERQVDHMSRSIKNMGIRSALELCYALGRFLNDPDKYLEAKKE